MIEEAEVASVIEGGEVASAIEEAEGGVVALVIEEDEEALVIEAGAEDLVVEVKIVTVGLFLNFNFDSHSYTFLSYGHLCPIKYMAWIISYKTLLSFTVSCSCHHSFPILFK